MNPADLLMKLLEGGDAASKARMLFLACIELANRAPPELTVDAIRLKMLAVEHYENTVQVETLLEIIRPLKPKPSNTSLAALVNKMLDQSERLVDKSLLRQGEIRSLAKKITESVKQKNDKPATATTH